jgi:hypothetical protein
MCFSFKYVWSSSNIIKVKNILALLTLCILIQNTSAQTNLSAGDIAFVGFNLDDSDQYAFILLRDIDNGTQIKFTDQGWNDSGSSFFSATGEGRWTWTASSALTCGTVVTINIPGMGSSASTGTVVQVGSDIPVLSGLGDQIFAYQGDDSNPTFIAGIHSNESSTDANWSGSATNNQTSALPDQLTNGSTAIRLHSSGTEVDNWRYSGAVVSGTSSVVRAAINDVSNWDSDNTSAFSPAAPSVSWSITCPSAAPSSATVAASVFLEGAFNGSNLNTTLNSSIPTTQPYSFNGHTGGSAGSIPANAVDWVLVELREAGSAAAALNNTKVGSAAGFLMNDGSIKATDGTSDLTISLSGNTGADFYVVVYHRNHLPIMSANAVSESVGSYSIDFTSNSASTYQTTNALVSLAGSKFGMPAGDIDQDGDIDATDLSTWRTNNGAVFSYSGSGLADFNLDGVINAVDRNDFHQKNTGKTRQVPGS